MLISIIQTPDLVYPGADEQFSPSESFPEYPFQHLASTPNLVYRAVRTCFVQAGLDKEHQGTEHWNPLGSFISPGSKVFVLCNFVFHRKARESEADFFSKCTHGSILRAVLDYVYIATGATGIIQFGNAPLQSCSWDRVLSDTGAKVVVDFLRNAGVALAARDLRLLIAERNEFGQTSDQIRRSEGDGVHVPLGRESLLNEFYGRDGSSAGNIEPAFRVADYDHCRTESFHGRDKHDYVVHREILSSDVIFSIPKLKTHEKVGITVGLKGMVGCVAHKDCLAHHRFGPPSRRGDEYPEGGFGSVLLSSFHDFVHSGAHPRWLRPLVESADTAIRRFVRRVLGRVQAGAWHGNDTAWRMTLDLARIMHFADSSGRMQMSPQRRHLVFVDGVVAGEGDGPLSPRAANAHTLLFTDDLVGGDVAACRLMGFPIGAIPLISAAAVDVQLNMPAKTGPSMCIFNGVITQTEKLPELIGRPFVAPRGWKKVLA